MFCCIHSEIRIFLQETECDFLGILMKCYRSFTNAFGIWLEFCLFLFFAVVSFALFCCFFFVFLSFAVLSVVLRILLFLVLLCFFVFCVTLFVSYACCVFSYVFLVFIFCL